MADVAEIIDGNAAGIHADFAFFQGNEFLFFAG
jgi:hypothetical protein